MIGGDPTLISYASYSDTGGRPCNEDTVEIRPMDGERLCAVLADGLGGHGGGKNASQAAGNLIIQGWDGGANPEHLRALADQAHQAVLAMQTPACQMKTTVVVLALDRDRAAWAYAGDSRLYHFENGRLIWQTRDHSASQIAVLLGQITPRQIRFHEDRSRIFRALGQRDGGNADVGEIPLTPCRHAFLLCSDGFWEYVDEEEMEAALAQAGTPEQWLKQMRKLLARRAPSDNDNNSAAAIWVER